MKKVEIVKVSGSVPGFAAPYQYVFSAYFDSPADLQRCMTDPKMGQVLDDVKNYFAGEQDVLVGETVGEIAFTRLSCGPLGPPFLGA